MKKVIVFASGGGSNFEALARAGSACGYEVALLVASKPGIVAVARAERLGIPVFIGEPAAEDLKQYKPDLVALAGWLKLVPHAILEVCPVLNIHPALLPAFGGQGMYGRRVHEAVLAAGAKESGPTVHVVTEEYDKGKIIMQARVPVLPGDTPAALAARVLEQEHKIYPLAIKNFFERKK